MEEKNINTFKFEEQKNKPSKKGIFLVVAISIILILVFLFFLKTGFTFSKIVTIKNIAWEKIFGELPPSEYLPLKDEDRINFLLLGIRGVNDKNGGLLTDSIMIVSLKKSTKQIALISIPRDLYVQMPGESFFEKINAAYALGLKKYQNGLDYTKKTIGYVTGLYIDHAAVVDFEGFKKMVDALGGVTIYLDKPFVEDKQWWCDENGENCRPFIVKAGKQTLDGETALLYIRSRFSSSDFDRIRRQQQVLLAIKDKILSLGVLANPVKINELFNIIADHIKTDVKPWEIPGLITLANNVDTEHIIKRVFDTSPEGLLQESIKDGIYILVPKDGNFDSIRKTCQQIFD